MTSQGHTGYGFPEVRLEEVFQRVIVPGLLLRANPVPQEHPRLVLLAGQPGSGKSTVVPAFQRQLAGRGGMVRVDTNDFRPFHPDYERLLAGRPADAADVTYPALLWWRDRAAEYLRRGRFNVLLEGGFRDPGWVAVTAEQFADGGYGVHVVALAVPAVLSRLAIVERYARQAEATGAGRWTTAASHQADYAGTVEVLRFAEASPAVSRISLRTRDGLIYDNHRGPTGAWATRVSAVDVLTVARDTPLNRLQCVALGDRLATTLERLERAGLAHPALYDMAAEVEEDLNALLADRTRAFGAGLEFLPRPTPPAPDLAVEL